MMDDPERLALSVVKLGVCAAIVVAHLTVPIAQAQELADEDQQAETAQVTQHLSAARQLAGTAWTSAVDFLCGRSPNPGNRRESPVIEPTWIFDDFAVLGRSGTVVYAINSSQGIILVDSGYPGEEESVLVPGLEQLGIDPTDVRYVVISHGHADHFGGARFLQERYGARVGASAEDWELMEQSSSRAVPPIRDVVVTEDRPIEVGDKKVTPVLIPGHTPGALGLIIPVTDGENAHMVGLFGGIISGITGISSERLEQYLRSIEHFSQVSQEMGVDVQVHNHPVFDGMYERIEQLTERRRPGTPHPFVVGASSYQDLLGVMSECIKVQQARQSY